VLRGEDGVVVADGRRWCAEADAVDESLLDRAVAPVLDIGCGPGRHVLALARRGIPGLGLDIAASLVRLARARGASVVQASVFGPVPAAGTWATGLLLDGNIGIGADPAALLAAVACVLIPGGRILVEVAPSPAGAAASGPADPAPPEQARLARVDHDGRLGPPFRWRRVDAEQLARCAAAAAPAPAPALPLTARWSAGGRCFAQIDLAGRGAELDGLAPGVNRRGAHLA